MAHQPGLPHQISLSVQQIQASDLNFPVYEELELTQDGEFTDDDIRKLTAEYGQDNSHLVDEDLALYYLLEHLKLLLGEWEFEA